MKIFEVEFEGVYPVGNCLIIAAENFGQAMNMAKETLKHTKDFTIKEVYLDNPKVIAYLNGDY